MDDLNVEERDDTTAEERAWLLRNWTPHETFTTWIAGSDRAHKMVPRLIAQVTNLERELVEARGNATNAWAQHKTVYERAEQYRTERDALREALEATACPHQQWFINKGVKHVTHEADCELDKDCKASCPRCSALAPVLK